MHLQTFPERTIIVEEDLSFYNFENILEIKLIYQDQNNTSLATIKFKNKKSSYTTSKHQSLNARITKFRKNVPFI